ncbi:MAG: cysteine--1-D-myo-inosityl 2-amino-2-deoxy-alpha-D-glucopyranoside ligase [Streptosporangiaceae bacterium]
MQSWPAPELPDLPGTGPPLRVHDTVTGEVRPTASGHETRMYVCGVTPYDATHIGHAATYVAFDLVYRVWRDSGHDVRYVQNVTDVDDPLLERAQDTGEDWRALAERQTRTFRADMEALRLVPPGVFMGAVEAIPLIVDLVRGLREKGAAYDVEGDLYFPVSADARFGSVAHLSFDEMVRLSAERGGDPDRAGKKDPLDCLLWQGGRPGEPAWDSPLGRGRPGWHVECSAIALAHLGMGLDIVGGGSDLAFPHHELGASEAHAATGRYPFARAYVHTGMVGLDGEKMSKSRGNLVFVGDLRESEADPMAVRLALLAHHYRADWEWRDSDLRDAATRLERWRTAVGRPSGPPTRFVLDEVRRCLANDLDAPSALQVVDRWADRALANGGSDADAPEAVRAAVDALLGVRL